MVHLVNVSGPHEDQAVYTIEAVDPVGPFSVVARPPVKPEDVTLEPGGRRVEWRWTGDEVRVEVPRVEIHDIVVLHGTEEGNGGGARVGGGR